MCNTISGYKKPLRGKKHVVRIPKKGIGIKMINSDSFSGPYKQTIYHTGPDGWITWNDLVYGKREAFTFFPDLKDVKRYLIRMGWKPTYQSRRFRLIKYEGGIQMREDSEFGIPGCRVALCKRFRFLN